MILPDEPERFADEADKASNVAQISQEEAMDRFHRRKEKAPVDFDGRHCVDCGEPIPELRLKTGAFRDIGCQQRHESKNKNHRSYFE